LIYWTSLFKIRKNLFINCLDEWRKCNSVRGIYFTLFYFCNRTTTKIIFYSWSFPNNKLHF